MSLSSVVLARGRRLAPALMVFAASRAVVVAAVVTTSLIVAYDRADFFFDWDGAHYRRIAAEGYPPLHPPEGGYRADAAFFPLLPLLARALSSFTFLSISASGVLIATLSSLTAVVAVWFAVRDEVADDATATRSLALWVAWPASFSLSMFYSDALMVTAAAACLLALRRRMWLVAGVAALLASAARPNGAILVLPCAWAAVEAIRRDRDLRSLVAPALAPLGTLAYFAYLYAEFDDLWMWFEAQRLGWGQEASLTRFFLVSALVDGIRQPDARFDLLIAGAAGLAAVALVIWMWRDRVTPEYAIFATGIIAVALLSSFGASTPRFVLQAFPLFIAPARRLRQAVFTPVVMASCGGLALMTVLITATRQLLP